jgi:uncharacterized protein (TIGR03437 family)
MLPLATWAQAQQANPVWFSQPQFLTYNGGLLLNRLGASIPLTGSPIGDDSSTLGQVPFTGEMFGVDLLLTPDTNSTIQQEVNAWKSRGGVYFFAADLISRADSSTPPDWDSFRMRNIDGGYVNNKALYSLSSPVFQAALKADALRAVDLGADGTTFDNCPGQLALMLYSGPHGSGSFDAVTMGAFRSYLQQKYSPAVLLAQFGIADISSFDFGVYIHANSLTETWNDTPLTGLTREFFFFKRQESLDFLRDVSSSTKQYARQKYGRDFLFNCNDGDEPVGYFLTDVMDLEYAELAEIRDADHPFAAVDIKAWKGWKSSITVKPFVPYVLGPTVNLERVLIADEEASGGMAGAQVELNIGLGVGNSGAIDLSVVQRYANFILNNPQLMSQTTTPARTLLVESAASMLGTTLSGPGANNSAYSNYFGTGRMLLDGGITYNSLFLPDTSYSQLPSLTISALTPYKTVLAPSAWALDDNQVAVLLAYAKQGGALIVDDRFAASQPDGTPATRPNVQAILATTGAQSYGSGQIVVTNANYGSQYESDDISAQRTTRAAFLSFLAPYASRDVLITQPPAQIHEPGITPFLYRDRNGNTLVHLVNYDYNDSTDQFYTKTNIQVQVKVGSQPIDDAILRSPDLAGAQSLPFTRDGDTITLTVPEVDAWDVLYFQQNARAPVINSATPAATLGATGGSSLSFSVQASDADGNPLTYVWSVNGQIVTGAFSPSYTLQIPYTAASGVETVTVSVTDGSRVVQTTWTINVAAYRNPRVLFDETHGEAFTIDAARASQLNPQNPQFVSYGTLAQAMQPLYQASRLTAGSFTSQVLNGADVIVLANPTNPLTAAEDQAVATFVQGGGALIFVADTGSNTSINSLIDAWGIQFDNTLIRSTEGGDPQESHFYASSYANHPALPTDPSFKTSNGGSLVISPPAVSLAQTDAAAWKSLSGQASQQPGDPNGPFTLIGATRFGKGRVFVVSSASAFSDGYAQFITSDTAIFLSALAWVSAAVNTAPPPLASTTASVSSVVNAASFAASISPGSWVTISGQNLANAPAAGRTWVSSDFNGNMLPIALNGTSVLINGRLAAVQFISPNQVNVLAPDDAYSGTVPVQVIGPAGIAVATVSLRSLAPALFSVVVGGTTYAAAVGSDGSAIGPTGLPGARAAKSGETLEVYGTGFGDTSPHQPAGQLVKVAPLVNKASATVCGQQAAVSFAGLVGPGLDQINVTLPAALAPGNCPIQLVVGSVASQSGVVVPIGQ